jgi:hypothetical protein
MASGRSRFTAKTAEQRCMTSQRWEKVHTISRYWNGPILGVADIDDVPHLYEKIFSEEEDDCVGLYRVMPIDQQLYGLLMERWSIFVRWRMACDQSKYPALPEDRDRYGLLDQGIGDREKPHSDHSRLLGARFKRTSSGRFHVLAQWEAQWQDQAVAQNPLPSIRTGLIAKDQDRDAADEHRNCKQCGHLSGPHIITAFDVDDFSRGGLMRCPVDGCNCESTISINPKLS